MAGNRIALDSDTALSHASKLNAATAKIPTGAHVRSAWSGPKREAAEIRFNEYIDGSTGDIEQYTNQLISVLTTNAAALRSAAAQMLQGNQISSDQSATFGAALDSVRGTAAPTPAPTTAGTVKHKAEL